MLARAPSRSRALLPLCTIERGVDDYRPLFENQSGVLLTPLTSAPIYSWYDRSEYSVVNDDASSPRFIHTKKAGTAIEERPTHVVTEGAAEDLLAAYLAADRAYLRCELRPPFASPLAEDVYYSAIVNFPSARTRSKVMVFLSKAGSITNLHFDEGPPLASISLRGSKRYTLIDPKYSAALQPYPEQSVYRRRSRMDGDLEAAEVSQKFPGLLEIPRHTYTIGPGECIVIPPLWWHAVKTLSDDTLSLVLST